MTSNKCIYYDDNDNWQRLEFLTLVYSTISVRYVGVAVMVSLRNPFGAQVTYKK